VSPELASEIATTRASSSTDAIRTVPAARRASAADHHRQDDHGCDFHDLLRRRRDVKFSAEEVGQRPVHHQRQPGQREDRVDGRERDVQRDVAMGQVAEDVGHRTTRRGGQQHEADREHRRQVEQLGDREGDHHEHDRLHQ
jgi:hypothetical protein